MTRQRSNMTGRVRIDNPEEVLDELDEVTREYWGDRLDGAPRFNPLHLMAIAATDPDASPAAKAKIGGEIAQYLWAKKKAVEVDAAPGAFAGGIQVVYYAPGGGDDPRVIEGEAARTMLDHLPPAGEPVETPDVSGDDDGGT